VTATGNGVRGWRDAMADALYGPRGFFRIGGAGPGAHFRTSAHASPLFAGAVFRLIERIDAQVDHPARFDVVDVGAGRGELLTALARTAADRSDGHGHGHGTAPLPLADRLRLTAVEVAPRPDGLSADIEWRSTVPDEVNGLLIATEWLDNVPLDLVEADGAGQVRRVLVAPTGVETPGDPVDAADAFWLARWWPLAGRPLGTRAEVGSTRDSAWAAAVDAVARGCALAVDYGHVRAERPGHATITGFRDGREVPPVPDGSCDITAHVALDAAAAAVGSPYTLRRQREALRALGVDGARPQLALASTDPAGYVRALAAASSAAELTDPAGLGGHWWLLHTVGVEPILPEEPLGTP
jgi:SAM-dependent MidA family methyltransferase